MKFVAEIAWLAARALYLFAPLLVAAAISGFVLRLDLLPWLRRPIDAGRSFGGHRWFGDSKTWRGVVVAVVGSVLATLVQKHVVGDLASSISVVDYSTVNPVWFGMAIGTGAMLGELPNSYVKRRLGIPPGGAQRGPLGVLFWIWDQVDLLTGAWPLLLPWVRPTTSLVLASIAIVLLLHPLVALVGYVTGARKSAR